MSDKGLPTDWEEVAFPDALSTELVRVGKVARADYLVSGVVPVVDQGQDQIAGYWDDPGEAYDGPLPVVVFGDHTRTVKLVDFRFVRGADGTHVLVPDRDLFDAEFFYYALAHTRLPNRGYNRHFSLLKERSLPQPSMREQRAIAHVLRTVQRAKEQTTQVVQSIQHVRRSALRHFFSEAFLGNAKLVSLGDAATWLSGGTPKTSEVRFWGGDIPWITSSSLKSFRLRDSDRRLTQEGVGNGSRLVPPGTTICVVRGMSLRKEFRVGITEREMAFGQDCKALMPDGGLFLPMFFAYAVKARSNEVLERVDRAGHGTGRLATDALKSVLIPAPAKQIQAQVVKAMTSIDNKLHAEEARLLSLKQLFKALLHGLMTGEKRVDDGPKVA
jgi:type I restriction enzyme S subunit